MDSAKLAEGAPALRRALVRLAARNTGEAASIDQLKYAAWKLIEWRDHPAPWRQVRSIVTLKSIDW